MQVVLIIAAIILFVVVPLIIKGLIFLIKHLFKNPWVNSTVSIILDSVILVLIVYSLIIEQTVSTFKSVLIIIYLSAIVDCIRDLKMAKVFYHIDYENLEDYLYNSFSKKSIWSFFTFGTARAVYTLIIYPIMALHARQYVISTMKEEKIVSGFPSSPGYHDYKIQRYVARSVKKGRILHGRGSIYIDKDYFVSFKPTLSNFMSSYGALSFNEIIYNLTKEKLIKEIIGKSDKEIKSFVIYVLDNLISYGAVHINKSTVAENSQLSRSKNDSSKPTNFLGKAAEIVTSKGRERKANREYNEFTIWSESDSWIYVSDNYLKKCQQTFADFMSTRGMLSIVNIVDGLRSAGLINEVLNNNRAQVKFFVAYVLDTLVELNTLEAANVSDEVFDNRQYRHVSGKAIASIDLSNDPRFAI